MAEIIQTLKVEASPELKKLFEDAQVAITALHIDVVELRQHVQRLEQRIVLLEETW